MYHLGLDIGTTTISAVVVDEGYHVIDSITHPHRGFLPVTDTFSRIQDAEEVISKTLEITRDLLSRYKVNCIGITGQQHGIVYLDKNGNCLSPLYTWQDGRGNQSYEGITYADYLNRKTGYTMASGYGLVTHFYNTVKGLVPEGTASFATIHDLLVMRLAGLSTPVTEPSDAHSLGFFDLQTDDFDRQAIADCGMDPAILPKVCRKQVAGYTQEGIPVAVAIGDNPASFLGTTQGQTDCVLLNIGTGSQISVLTQQLVAAPPLETRPFPLGGFLLVGAALCGGRAWAMTEQFFSDVLYAFTGERTRVYDKLNTLLEQTEDLGSYPRIRTCFDGTRADPAKRGSVENLTRENFNPGQFALGILHGMIDELYEMYAAYLRSGLPAKNHLIGSGNGLRLNKHLCRVAEETFRTPMTLSSCPEEAAVGAAIYADIVVSQK